MKAGEIYLASFPFGAGSGRKLRPVLLLTGPIGDVPEVLVAYISSVIPSELMTTDIVLDPITEEHSSTRLKTASVLRLHKLATVHGRSIVRHLGVISEKTSSEVGRKLRAFLGL